MISRFGPGIAFGVHTGLQDTSVRELTALWKQLDDAGYDWLSVWDHFYSAERSAKSSCFEAVAMHALLAATTTHAKCGVLVYNVGYRHPAVIANAVATIDHISGGRAVLGLGCGWHELEHNAYGLPFGSVSERLDRLEEAVQCVRLLLEQERTTFNGRFYVMDDARCDPKPIQRRLPIIIGGGGIRRTLRQVAQYSDGLNIGFISPREYASRLQMLRQHCQVVGRDPASFVTSVNLGLQLSNDSGSYQNMPFDASGGILKGTIDDILDQVAAYIDVGVEQVNFAVRAPFPTTGLLQLADSLGLTARKRAGGQHGR